MIYNKLNLFEEIKKTINSKEYNIRKSSGINFTKKIEKEKITLENKKEIFNNIYFNGTIYLTEFDTEEKIDEIIILLESVLGKTINNKNKYNNKYEIITAIENPQWFFESHYSQPVHTDEGHEKIQPNILALYCKENSEFGGDNILVNSKLIYKLLIEKYGDKVDLLFHNDCITCIKKNNEFTKNIFLKIKENIGISFSPLINEFKCTQEIYEMLKDINYLIHQKENQIFFKLKENQCIIFSNYLYLHSRTFFPKNSKRTLYRIWF
ncbi:TauD/TfdA family dioxygenase [Xenorhabdus eapokensis]|uniref:Gamma-butyrobetaine dioxygenase n=1 Tax=Xenorhabdus eapokensis TaxID=1873482 RepID=A0A1Q5TYE1_9GAMM|nr:TauD/TfdA family dioxygenase [Xenorhabdus eapokensis]OKP04813.1 gamma-butyrobetaine dioxygenase [Xenorhabdus eapokensis]OKP05244.1 gamma-butyrobetaine dioxygenase [Xenorhabdus eapokensis]